MNIFVVEAYVENPLLFICSMNYSAEVSLHDHHHEDNLGLADQHFGFR